MWDVHCFDYKSLILVLFRQVLVRYDAGCALRFPGICHFPPDFAQKCSEHAVF